LRQHLQDRFSGDPNVQIQSVAYTYDIWLPDWKAGRYVRGCQAKVQTNVGDYVFLILLRGQSWDIVSYAAVSKLGPSGFALGIVYAEFWKDQQELESQLLTTQVVLRDLDDSRGGLHGKYVSVEDNLTDVLLDDADGMNWRVKPDSLRSGFDRVMAYYHVNLAQRYFRQLGLTVLDDDPYLNPLQVILTGRAGSSVGAGYRPDRKAIVLRELFDSSNPDTYREWTLARDARVVYHEYVHAVTDSLARLQRVDKSGGDCDNIRLLEMTQSVAMDEGLADYFACSLTERQGAHPGEYGDVISVAGGFYWVLGQRRIDPSKADLKSVINASADDLKKLCQLQPASSNAGTPQSLEEQYYLWGTIWASFLWKLRDALGPDVADTIIAHSILFLSRWSGFLVGVCALIQADHLLFSGLYRDTIIELSGLDEELRRQMIEQEQAQSQPWSKEPTVGVAY
jgi:hypothetical protein